MRKLIARSVVALFAVVAMSSTAWAAWIPIGTVSFSVSDGGDGVLSLTNQTGDNVQPDDFPVEDFVPFLNIFLTTAPGGVLTPGVELIDTNLPDLGYNFDSAGYPVGTYPRSVLIGGSVANQLVELSTGGNWQIGGNVFMCVIDPGAPPCLDNGGVGDDLVGPNGLAGGELGVIYVEGVAMPEPMTFSLLGLGVAGVLARRRVTARR